MAPSSWQKTIVGGGSCWWEVFVLVKRLCKWLAHSILIIHPCFSFGLHFCSQVFLPMRYSVGILLSYQNKNTNYNTEWRVTPWMICKAHFFLAKTKWDIEATFWRTFWFLLQISSSICFLVNSEKRESFAFFDYYFFVSFKENVPSFFVANASRVWHTGVKREQLHVFECV